MVSLTNQRLRVRPFVNGDPDWDKCLDEFVTSIEESANTSSERSTEWAFSPTTSRNVSPLAIVSSARRRSSGASSQTIAARDPHPSDRTSTIDSGYDTTIEQLEDILEEEEDESDATHITKDVIDRTLIVAIGQVETAIQVGNLKDAITYQRRIPGYRRRHSGDTPVDTVQICRDEIKLASVYRMTRSPKFLQRAYETLTNALQRLETEEITPPRMKLSLIAQVSHSLGRVCLEIGNPIEANKHLWAAWRELTKQSEDVISFGSDSNDTSGLQEPTVTAATTSMDTNIRPVVQSVGTMLYRISMQANKPEIADSLDIVALERFKFSLKTLAWCQDAGFDTEHENFRFDVLCEQEGSKVKGTSPLHHAAKECEDELLGHMLAEGVNLEVEDALTQATPFLVACSKQDIAAVNLLLEHSARADARDKARKNGLHLCQGTKGGTQVAKRLLELGAVPIDARDAVCKTALCMASEMANRAMISYLCSKGANPNGGGPGDYTPLMAAVEARMQNRAVKEDILKTLLQNEADPMLTCMGKTAADMANDKPIKKLLESAMGRPTRRFPFSVIKQLVTY